MAKKPKASVASVPPTDKIASAVKESAQEIWLAGLGAFAKAQEEGSKVFKALVREGTSMQKRTMEATETSVNDVTGKVTQAAGALQKQATGTWDKLEGVFEERVERALSRLGVPTRKDIDALHARLDEMAARKPLKAAAKRAPSKRAAKKS